ncbi:PH domain-containing protein [Nocardiopsis sp. ARC36]
MPVFAVVSYALTHWGFSLRGRDGSLVAERGLFTRRSVTLERRRIRGHELLDTPLERTRGAVRLRAIVTGLGDAANRAVLLPTGPRPVVEDVVGRALALFGGTLKRHPRAALFRRLTRAVGPFALVAVVAAALGAEWLAVAGAVLAVLGIPLGVDRYRALGHGYDGERVSVRSGSLSRSQATVERSAVIGWTWRQTLFQRGPSLADLQVTVGAGAGATPSRTPRSVSRWPSRRRSPRRWCDRSWRIPARRGTRAEPAPRRRGGPVPRAGAAGNAGGRPCRAAPVALRRGGPGGVAAPGAANAPTRPSWTRT